MTSSQVCLTVSAGLRSLYDQDFGHRPVIVLVGKFKISLISSGFSKSRFAVNKCTKRGFTCLCIPGHDPPLSIIVYGDISPNPGPKEITQHAVYQPPLCPHLDVHYSAFLCSSDSSTSQFTALNSYRRATISLVDHRRTFCPNDGNYQTIEVISRWSSINSFDRNRNYARYNKVNRGRNLHNLTTVPRAPPTSYNSTQLLYFGLLNARSLNNKTLVIKDYVVDNKLDILALTETWLKADSDSDFTIGDICPSGFAFMHIPRNKTVGGGVGLLYRSSLKLEKLYTRTFRSFEVMEARLYTSSSIIHIVTVYRPPSSSTNGITCTLFLDEFSSFLELLISSPGKLFITGDFNFHVDDLSDQAALKFLDLLNSFNLQQHIKVPTHKKNHTLDLIITRSTEITASNFSVYDPVISDHMVVHCNLHVDKPPCPKKKITYRNFRSLNMDDFRHDIVNSDLFLSPEASLTSLCDQYDTVLTAILDNHAPEKTKIISQRPAAPWYTSDIAAQKTIRRKLERRWRQTKLAVDRQLYSDQCLLVKNLIFSIKMQYYSKLIEDAGSDHKQLFKTIDRLLHRKPEKLYPSCSSSSDLVDKFARFFTTKISTIRNSLVMPDLSCLDFSQFDVPIPQDRRLDYFSPTSVEELSMLIGKTASKSCCLDPLPSKLMVQSIGVILPIICEIVNLSFEASFLPSSLKKAALSPLLKKRSLDHEVFPNFRPVSNLKMVSKVIEKVVAKRLNHHFDEHNLNEPFQSAYKQYHSCETALVRINNDVLRAIDDRRCVVLLLLDLSAAFDTVDHELLLQRMSSKFGISGKALDWFGSYLKDRSQYVAINGSRSASHDLKCGVPQGSVLGPILYLMYTSPLGDICRHHGMSFHLYADDCQLYATFSCNNDHEIHQTVVQMENCLKDIVNWMSINKLKLNTDKTELIVISSRHQAQPVFPGLSFGPDVISPSDSVRNIGVIFDRTLSMAPHINNVCKTSFYHLRNIARIRKYLSFKSTETLVHAFITSKLDYCNSLFYGLPKYLLKKLQYVQNAAARIITRSRKYDHITPLLMDLHWLPIEERIQFKILLLTYKSLNGMAPIYLEEMITRYQPKRTLRSSSMYLLKQESFNLVSYGKRAFTISAPQLWNLLPIDIKQSASIDIFKTKVKTHLFKSVYKSF